MSNTFFTDITVTNAKSKRSLPQGPLGFGQYFSDHMFLARHVKEKGWEQAQIQPHQALPIDPACAVLHYGQSVFEGLKAFRTQDDRVLLFRPDFHAKRLQTSASALCLPKVESKDFINACKMLVGVDQHFIPKNAGEALYLRPLLFAAENFLGVRPADEALFLIITSPVGGYYGKTFAPISIWVEETASRVAPGGIGFAKTSANYAASLSAATQAKKKGFNQVLWLDASQHRFVEEVGTMNIFFRLQDKLITPNLSGNILPGCVRDTVITLAKEMNIAVEERPISIDEVFAQAKAKQLVEVFGTGTAAIIAPIQDIANTLQTIHFSNHEYAKLFYEKILGIQRGSLPDTHAWTVAL